MTEAEWLAGEDPKVLFANHGRADLRKRRLFACGCCRAVWAILPDRRCRVALRKLEESADDVRNDRLRRDAYNAANAAYLDLARAGHPKRSAACAVVCAAYPGVTPNLFGNIEFALTESGGSSLRSVRLIELAVLRDIFGNPFRPVVFSPSWRTDTAVSLAQQMYDAREFSAMPILADALQDAGCDSDDILSHCRDTNATHVRGCWVVDLVLGKQ
jgi:hypothetical protein